MLSPGRPGLFPPLPSRQTEPDSGSFRTSASATTPTPGRRPPCGHASPNLQDLALGVQATIGTEPDTTGHPGPLHARGFSRGLIEHKALRQARRVQQTDDWKDRYNVRAGIEGSIAQATQGFGMRRSRYRGRARTSLQHQLTGAAINLTRIDARLTQTPRSRTRTSHLTALRPVG